jgi:acetyl-CoA acetyltransferase
MTRPEVLIVGGARTPMTDYVGVLKDVSALELGAIASRGVSVADRELRPLWRRVILNSQR